MRAGLSRIAIRIAPTGDATMRRAITMPMKKQIAMKRNVDQPGCTSQVTKPRLMTGVGTPGSPFSPPVNAESGEFSRKKNTSAIATVIMAK